MNNLFNISTAEFGYYYNYKDGVKTVTSNTGTSDFIEIKQGSTYATSSDCNITYWDENKQFVNGIIAYKKFTVPNNEKIKYIKMSIWWGSNGVTKENYWMLVEGDKVPSEFIPYAYESVPPVDAPSEDAPSVDVPPVDDEVVKYHTHVMSDIVDYKNYINNNNNSYQETLEPLNNDVPKVFFTGTFPTTKTSTTMGFEYISLTNHLTGYVDIKCQGTSSMSYPKKNFTIKLYKDANKTSSMKFNFKNWGEQSKFCLKANYVDTTHTRNVSGAKIASDMVDSRPSSSFKTNLKKSPRNGLVDGFPIKVFLNGLFYGIYTWNIPKDGWMFGMSSSNANHIVLCAEKNNDGNMGVSTSCQFRKAWDGIDGGEWSVEFGTLTPQLLQSFNKAINFVVNSSDADFKNNIGNYFDLYSLIDYYCFSYLTCHIDGLAKNMLMITYDGIHWGASLYDMDSIYGANWTGSSFKSYNLQCPNGYQETNSLLWQRMEKVFGKEIYNRYVELRKGALSLGNIVSHVEHIYDLIDDRMLNEEWNKWSGLPSKSTNTMYRFREFMSKRADYVDNEIKKLNK